MDDIEEIYGILEGQFFENRRELNDANEHRGLMQTISAIRESIFLFDCYVYNKDSGGGVRHSYLGLKLSDQRL